MLSIKGTLWRASQHLGSVAKPCLTAQMAEWYRIERMSLELYTRVWFESGKTNDFKTWYSLLPCLTLSIKERVWKTTWQVYLLCHWERRLEGFPHLGVVDRWLATLKQARIALWSLSRDRRINMKLKIKESTVNYNTSWPLNSKQNTKKLILTFSYR